MKAVLFGSLSIDENEINGRSSSGPGGAVYFLAKTFQNLQVSVDLLSSYGKDFPKSCLPSTDFILASPNLDKNLSFRNLYIHGNREQKVENYEAYQNFSIPTFKINFSEADLVFVAPIISNITLLQMKKIKSLFPQSFFCLLPQGFYRHIGENGKIIRSNWQCADDVMADFDFVSLSTEDVREADILAKNWSHLGPIVTITKAENGSSLYKNGKRLDIPTFRIDNIVDPTGAGDVFAASFAFAYLKSQRLKDSLAFATASACLSLPLSSDKLQYSYRDIINFAHMHNCLIKI
ncbi:hypothetical protein HY029_05115 [Candidatus Gottesmanbacteria bacterium]|nr:hypothetical protein [Candidatus Gottesmanbacteria bacterium]